MKNLTATSTTCPLYLSLLPASTTSTVRATVTRGGLGRRWGASIRGGVRGGSSIRVLGAGTPSLGGVVGEVIVRQ